MIFSHSSRIYRLVVRKNHVGLRDLFFYGEHYLVAFLERAGEYFHQAAVGLQAGLNRHFLVSFLLSLRNQTDNFAAVMADNHRTSRKARTFFFSLARIVILAVMPGRSFTSP